MPSIITEAFAIGATEIGLVAIGAGGSNTSTSAGASLINYVTIGKTLPWANGDSNPDTPNESQDYINQCWRNMMGGKIVSENDMTLVVPNITWATNTVYSMFSDQDQFLYTTNSNFYILTSDYNVYKCIFNNYGNVSTVQPTQTSTSSFGFEVDGYAWKYMYSLNTNDKIRFLTSAWMPVRYLTENNGSLQWQVQESAIPGSLLVALVNNRGVNYTNTSNISVIVTGDGLFANAFATVNAVTNTISTVTFNNPGEGYTFASLSIVGGGGSGANAYAVVSPSEGHGSNPVYELGATTFLINVRLNGSENGTLTIDNDYRQVTILQNPIPFGGNGSVFFSNTNFTQETLVQVIAGQGQYVNSAFLAEETVYQGSSPNTASFYGTVVDWDSSNNIVKLSNVFGIPAIAPLLGEVSGTSRLALSYTPPNLQPYIGAIAYISNIPPVVRSPSQTDDLKIYVPIG